MASDLTASRADRQTILNNDRLIGELQQHTQLPGIRFSGDVWYTPRMAADCLAVDPATIERTVRENREELAESRYERLTGDRLAAFLACADGQADGSADPLEGFPFRAFLNLALLLADSAPAKRLRLMVLDIAIDLINQPAGGATTYVDQPVRVSLREEQPRPAPAEGHAGRPLEELDFGRLESVLLNIQNDDYYPTFVDKLTHLFFCACQFHCFADGNKRVEITLPTLFLLLNGYSDLAQTFLAKTENISLNVAAGNIGKDLLHKLLSAILDGTYDADEALRLELYHAIARK